MTDNRWLRNGFVWIILIIAVIALWVTFINRGDEDPNVPINEVAQAIEQGRVEKLEKTDGSNQVTVYYLDQEDTVKTRIDEGTSVEETLEFYGVDPSTVPIIRNESSSWGDWLGILTILLPILLIVGIVVFMMRSAQGSNNQAISFGKSRARMFTGNKPTVTFDDVAGVEEAKEELVEVVEFLKYPEKFAALGARIPSGVLLVGPPGTGKTLLARAVAGEAGVPFFSISGSEFVEMFVGVGASRVRDLFEQAKRNAPCIIFVDEIDAVGRQRGAGLGGSHDEREQTLNQILVEMDGFDSTTNVIVVAATNRPDVLDPALLRPGRFDRQVILDRPDIRGRVEILGVHTRGKPLEEDINPESIARQTPGFSGADLENLVNEAAILAARRNKKTIGRDELAEAIDRVVAGPKRKSRVITDREKLMTAYHEAGHALIAREMAHVDPLHKVSIIARGMAGGYTRVAPDDDRSFWTKAQFEDMLAFMMGGRIAEEIIFSEISTGASNDIERASDLARRMVTEYGMSETLGPLALGKKDELVFLGREINDQRNYSEEVAFEIDKEIRRFIERAYERATELIKTRLDKLEAIAMILMERETVEGAEIEALFDTPRPKPQLTGPMTYTPVEHEDAQPEGTASDDDDGRDLPPSTELRPSPSPGG